MNTTWQATRLVGLILLGFALTSDLTYGQRGGRGGGDRGGGGGDRGGRGGFSAGQQGGRGFSGGQPSRSFSDGQPSGRGFSGRSGGEGRQFSGRPSRSPDSAIQQRGEGRRQFGEERRSFYRGDSERSVIRDGGRRDSFDRSDQDRFGRQTERFNRREDRVGDRFGDSRRFDSDRDRDSREGRFIDQQTGRFGNRFDFERYRWDGRNTDWDRTASRIRNQWGNQWNNWDRGNIPFRSNWWNNYGGQWPVFSPWLYSGNWSYGPNYWWGWTPANRLTNWLVFGWNRPFYWGYGPGRNIYYQGDYVYYDGRRVMPATEYYDYVYDLGHNVPDIDAEEAKQMEWQPLGVFAAKRPNENDSQRLLQLAVNKEGLLSGSYYNRESDQMLPLAGRVDDRTQRATWHFADGSHEKVVFETSLYNLTQDEATMMVHFGPQPEDAQIWDLVRLEAPESESATSSRETRNPPTQNLP